MNHHDDKENAKPLPAGRRMEISQMPLRSRSHRQDRNILQNREGNHLINRDVEEERYDNLELGLVGKLGRTEHKKCGKREKSISSSGIDQDRVDDKHISGRPSLPETFTRKSGLDNETDFDYVLILYPVKEVTEFASIVDFDADCCDFKPQMQENTNLQKCKSQNNDNYEMNLDEDEDAKIYVLDINAIPETKLPRGLAKNLSYEQRFLDDFMLALENGFVVRRHIPGRKPFFMKLWSKNRGDTINYDSISPTNANRFLKKQIEIFGNDCDSIERRVSAWAPSCEEEESSDFISLPDKNRRLGTNEIVETLTNNCINSGHMNPERLVEVLGAEKEDHLASKTLEGFTDRGSHSFGECLLELDKQFQVRKERNDASDQQFSRAKLEKKYISLAPVRARTLTLILPSRNRRFESMMEAQDAWYDGKALIKDFIYMDIETATDGEYFLLLRGFSHLLSEASFRDSSSRFKMGLSSLKEKFSIDHLLNGPAADDKKNKFSTIEEFRGHPRCVTPEIRIWNRLKRCGLQIEATFDVDGAIMIKTRCPTDKLLNVAHALSLKLKTLEGDYAAFDKKLLDTFQPTDAWEESFRGGVIASSAARIFSSAVRQHLIYYIINSLVGDDGAGLGVNDRLSRAISIKSPIHMRARLNALYSVWREFTLDHNWKVISQENNFEQKQVPPGIKRHFYGMFYMPLDSIEQYYGEKVAFYFAWLQHSTIKLIFPSAMGIVVTLWQVLTNSWHDNYILPLYSFAIMIWSFRVMISWKQKQNDLAFKWGSMNFIEDESPRPQFYGERDVLRVKRKVFIEKNIAESDGRSEIKEIETLHYVVKNPPRVQRWLKYCFSISMSLVVSFGALFVILILHKNRDLNLTRYLQSEKTSGKYVSAAQIVWNISIIGNTDSAMAVELSADNLKDLRFWWIAGLIPSMIGIILPLLNQCLLRVSKIMNDIEDHKTETHYRNALVGKVIAFRFVSYFGTLYYYIIFAVSGSLMSTGKDADIIKNGFVRISTSLMVFLSVQQVWIHTIHIVFPIFVSKMSKRMREYRMKKENSGLDQLRQELHRMKNPNYTTTWEQHKLQNHIKKKETLLDRSKSKLWEEMSLTEHDPFFDYVQSIIFFTYVVCFSSVFPLTPLLVLFNQLINMRLHAYKICKLRRRPLAQKTGGLAVWEKVLNFSTLLGVITNSVLMVFTNPMFSSVRSNYSSNESVALFACAVICERIMISIRYFMTILTPDKSKWLVCELQKQKLWEYDKKK